MSKPARNSAADEGKFGDRPRILNHKNSGTVPLRLDNLFAAARDAPGCVAGVDNGRSVVDDPLIVDAAVVCGDQDEILTLQHAFVQWQRRHMREIVGAHLVQPRNIGIAIRK